MISRRSLLRFNNKRNGVVRMAIAIGIATAASPVVAQTLDEVVVTATRRSESIQDVPASVSTFTGETLEKLKIDDVGDLAGTLPNLSSVQPYGEGGSPFFVLRGVTTTDYTFSQSSPIALYIDDAVRGLPPLEIGHMYDVERIEVLRGPQGSLYGKNATGGAVNVITRTPDFEQEGYLTLGYGSFDRIEAKGAFQSALADDVLAARVAFSYVKDDGIIENKLPNRDDDLSTDFLSSRLSLLYTPSDNFEAILRIYRQTNDARPYSVFSEVTDPGLTGGLTRAGLDFHESRSQRPDVFWETENTGVNLTLNWEVSPSYTLVSVTSYDDAKLDYQADDDGLELALDESKLFAKDIKQFTQELRVISDSDGPFNWIGGIFFGSDEMDNSTVIYTLDDPALGFVDTLSFVLGTPATGGTGFHFGNFFHQERDSSAVYVNGKYDLTPTVTLRAGYRYSEDDVDVTNYDAFFGETTAAGERVLSVPVFLDAGLSESYDNSSVEAGIDWQATENVLAYFNFSQGYRSGAINGQAFSDAGAEITAARPEEIDSYEVGVKSTLRDGSLTLNAAYFHYDYTNQQFLIAEGGGFLFPLRNAPKAKVDGFEAELQLQATDQFYLTGAIGWLNSEYEELTILGTSAAGNQMIGAPDFTANLGFDWQLMTTEDGEFSLNINGAYQSEVFFTPFEEAALSEDSYWVMNGRLSYDSDRYSVGVWSKNLLDEEYFIYGLDLTSTYGAIYFQRGAPRTFGIDFTYRF